MACAHGKCSYSAGSLGNLIPPRYHWVLLLGGINDVGLGRRSADIAPGLYAMYQARVCGRQRGEGSRGQGGTGAGWLRARALPL